MQALFARATGALKSLLWRGSPGSRQPRVPSDFLPEDYLYLNPDLLIAGADPAAHYRLHGRQEGRRYRLKAGESHPLFDQDYYRAKYQASLGAENPLSHFIAHGHSGFNPSPRFDSRVYIEETKCTGNPLRHYIEQGISRGIAPSRAEPFSRLERLESAFLKVVTPPLLARHNVLLVTYSADGAIKPHVLSYVQALADAGKSVILIITSDLASVHVDSSLLSVCSGVLIRQNMGFDFAAWFHVLRNYPQLQDSDQLILANDSMIGPISGAFERMMKRLDASSADVVGLTENPDYSGHIQSFFIALNGAALKSDVFRSFCESVVNLEDKDSVIFEYELTLRNRMRAGGLRTEALFENMSGRNDPIFLWSDLLDKDFPFIKAEVVKNATTAARAQIETKLRILGFDVSLLPADKTSVVQCDHERPG